MYGKKCFPFHYASDTLTSTVESLHGGFNGGFVGDVAPVAPGK